MRRTHSLTEMYISSSPTERGRSLLPHTTTRLGTDHRTAASREQDSLKDRPQGPAHPFSPARRGPSLVAMKATESTEDPEKIAPCVRTPKVINFAQALLLRSRFRPNIACHNFWPIVGIGDALFLIASQFYYSAKLPKFGGALERWPARD